MEKYDSITQQINTLVKTPEPAGSMFSNLDQQRDLIVKKVGNDYDTQTNVMTVNKQVKDVVGFFKQNFGASKDTVTRSQVIKLQSDIQDVQSSTDQLNSMGPVIQQLVILIATVAVVYFFGSTLGSLVHTAAFVILITGTYYIISGTPNNGQSSINSIFTAISNFSSSVWSTIASSL